VNISALSSIKEHFMTMDRLMQFALGLGMFHVVFGKAVAAAKIKKQKGIKHSLAPWAWVFFLIAMLIMFAPTALAMFGKPLNVPPLPLIVQHICWCVAGINALVILFYNMPGKNIFFNFGAAIWNIYNAASGMLGDTLSYVRLFAIGLTGGILGGVFNMLGIDLTASLPIYARIPLMLFILVFGHGMNIALCTISSLVHPLRLIFVEYFRNSEYEGGGVAYTPFKKNYELTINN
jgi:V/A-type H+-transporting ATPase subunit I